MRIPASSIRGMSRMEMPQSDPNPGHSPVGHQSLETQRHRKPGKGTSCVFLVLFLSSENLSPVLKQRKKAANVHGQGARELPWRSILTTNPGDLQKLPMKSNPETFQNTFFPEE